MTLCKKKVKQKGSIKGSKRRQKRKGSGPGIPRREARPAGPPPPTRRCRSQEEKGKIEGRKEGPVPPPPSRGCAVHTCHRGPSGSRGSRGTGLTPPRRGQGTAPDPASNLINPRFSPSPRSSPSPSPRSANIKLAKSGTDVRCPMAGTTPGHQQKPRQT